MATRKLTKAAPELLRGMKEIVGICTDRTRIYPVKPMESVDILWDIITRILIVAHEKIDKAE